MKVVNFKFNSYSSPGMRISDLGELRLRRVYGVLGELLTGTLETGID